MGVGGLWAEGYRASCQIPIKKLKAMKENTTSLAPGELTHHLRAQFCGTSCGRVSGSVGLCVGDLRAKI